MAQLPKDQIFVGQTDLVINFDSLFSRIADASVVKILVKKPNGTKVMWTPDSISGTVLSYSPKAGDLDIAGLWWFQAYFIMNNSGLETFGALVSKEVFNNIKQ
jgi:hypothetical protein